MLYEDNERYKQHLTTFGARVTTIFVIWSLFGTQFGTKNVTMYFSPEL